MDEPFNLKPSRSRLTSLDALRGFAMFWIIGARDIANGLIGLGIPRAGALADQLTHSEWNGFHFYDLIFPMFIYVVGASLVFGIRRRQERAEDRRAILRQVLKRTILLFLLGIFYNGGVSQPDLVSNLRVMGVLQRIALVYFFASVLVLTTSIRTQAASAVGLLVAYWLVMRLVPVPGFGAGVWTPEGNLVKYIDMHLLPGQLYWDTWDPEGILSTAPAIATGLLGVLTGHWLRADKGPRGETLTKGTRASYLFLAGVAGASLGLLAGLVFPINKSLWTSSFVLLTGGLSAALLAVFYWLIEVRGRGRWAFPLVVIGLNSIAIYLGVNVIPFDEITRRLVGGDISAMFGPGRAFFEAIFQFLIEWLALLWMFRRKIFIRL
ncbi:MAG: DUF5009 domain-containing protein [Firmicutes bacterium]|nr:DUF5009 domain-containing protein [Bacillota bacterium]